jgi:hypothetical protein
MPVRTSLVLLAALGAVVVGCERRDVRTPAASASPGLASASDGALTDLSTSLDAVRTAFNARTQQPRFLTLLSPG